MSNKFERRVRTRIEELKKQRQDFLEAANQEVAAYNGSIRELEQLLKDPEEEGGGEEE